MDELKATLSKPPLLPIQFDEFCDILGGQSWQEFITQISNSQQRNRIKSLSKLKPFMLGNNHYLYSEKNHYRFALEKLYLKLAVVSQLCRLVRNNHRLLQKIIGVINPRTVRIALVSGNTLVPAYWNYKIAFGDIDESQFLKERRVDAYTRPWETKIANDPRVDLYSLGMMLFRAILANCDEEFHKIQPVILQIVNILHVEFPANSSAAIERNLLSRLNQILSDDILLPIRKSIAANSDFKKFINETNWMKILIIGVRLVTQIPGFSYGELSHYQDENNWNVAEEVFNDIEKVANEIKQSMLIEPIEMNADLAAIVSKLVADTTWIAELCTDPTKKNNYTNLPIEKNKENNIKIGADSGSHHHHGTTQDDASCSNKPDETNDSGLSILDKQNIVYHRIKEAGVLHNATFQAGLNLDETLVQSRKTSKDSRINNNVNKSATSARNSSFYFAHISKQEFDDETDILKETLIQKPR